MNKTLPFLSTALGLASLSFVNLSPASTLQADSLVDALKQHTTTLDLRYRLEVVDLDNDALDTGIASTLRTRLTYQSANYQATRLLLEFDNVTLLGEHSYNNFRNTETRARIADDHGTEINQAALTYTGVDGLAVTVGRQRIVFEGIHNGCNRQPAAAYHHFTATESIENDNYGQEINLSASRNFGPVNALLKYAFYKADDLYADTHKAWLMLSARF